MFSGTARTLRRDTVSHCIGMESTVFSKTEPAARILVRFGNIVRIVGGKILPRIVTNDGQECPRSAFQMLHQNRPARSIARSVRWRAQYLLQLLTVAWRG